MTRPAFDFVPLSDEALRLIDEADGPIGCDWNHDPGWLIALDDDEFRVGDVVQSMAREIRALRTAVRALVAAEDRLMATPNTSDAYVAVFQDDVDAHANLRALAAHIDQPRSAS